MGRAPGATDSRGGHARPKGEPVKGLGGLLAGTRRSGQVVSWSEAPGLAEGAAGPGAGALGPGEGRWGRTAVQLRV